MANDMTDDLTIRAISFDCGAHIGVAVEYKGERRAVRIPNPFWPEIDAAWRASHPGAVA